MMTTHRVITGRAGMTWEGLNAPVQMTKDMDRDGDQDQGRDQGRERWDKQRNEGPKPGQRSFQRGWSGTTWPGRKIGPPETPDGGWCLSIYLLLVSPHVEIEARHVCLHISLSCAT